LVRGPLILERVVEHGSIEALAVEDMSSGYEQVAIREKGVPGAKEIDRIAFGIDRLILGGFRGSGRILGIPNESMFAC